jgi:peptide deformylase
MKLIEYPDLILSKKCVPVEVGDCKVAELLTEMTEKLYEWKGAGLAAPQIGVLKRMTVVDVRDTPSCLYKLINPKIIWKSEEMVESNEGCLSLPLLRETILRHESITVEYMDENFEKCEVHATGFFSCCLQHELDHLDGVLFIDHLSKLKRSRAISRFKKLQLDKQAEMLENCEYAE